MRNVCIVYLIPSQRQPHTIYHIYVSLYTVAVMAVCWECLAQTMWTIFNVKKRNIGNTFSYGTCTCVMHAVCSVHGMKPLHGRVSKRNFRNQNWKMYGCSNNCKIKDLPICWFITALEAIVLLAIEVGFWWELNISNFDCVWIFETNE